MVKPVRPSPSASGSTWSGIRIALSLLLMAFVAEIGVMLILPSVLPEPVGSWKEALLDAGMLSLAMTPMIYWIIVVPLRRTLAETRTRSEAILSSAADGIITINPEGTVETVNHAAEKMFGYTGAEIVGRNVSILMPAPQCDEHDGHLERYARTGERRVIALRREVVGQRRDGTTFPMDLHISEIRHAQGRVFAGIITDTTQRKRAEREMAALARFPDENPAPVLRVGDDGTVMYANEAAGILLTEWDCRVGDRLSDQWRKFILDGVNSPELPSREVRCGSCIWMLTVSAVAECGYVNIYAADITDRTRVEKELRENNTLMVDLLGSERAATSKLAATLEKLTAATEEAQAASQSKSDFLANMSHEIRTPMTAILGFAEELEANIERPENRDAARTIKRNGNYLLRLINDILDLSKIEAGKMTVEAIAVSPLGIVEEIKSLMQVRAQERGLTLAADYVFPLPETIQTDPTRLRQILVNLVGNGIKFTETGSVTIRATFEDGPHPQLRFDVIDTGIGMSAEAVQGLFQPFAQVDSSTTRRFGGTGLGLAICKRLANILGGNISVTSESRRGSTFSLSIATGPLDAVRIRASRDEGHRHEGDSCPISGNTDAKLECRILLVEDGPDNRKLISLILERAGAKVTFAENGRIGVERALESRDAGSPFDLILMDMQMPVMDGYQATRRLRRSGWSGPIIALTANAMSSDRDKCLTAGCTEYTTKPIDREELTRLIRDQLRRQSQLETV